MADAMAAGSDGGPPLQISHKTIENWIQSAKPARDPNLAPSALAERMLKLLEAEIRSLERQRGHTDVDRLDKIAATLRRLEPLRVSSERERSPKLRSLLEDNHTEGVSGEGAGRDAA